MTDNVTAEQLAELMRSTIAELEDVVGHMSIDDELVAKVSRDLESIAARLSGMAAVPSTGWLIERKHAGNTEYRTMRHGLIEWTLDHNEALRFCRRVDADRFAEEDMDDVRIVEHAWHDLPAAPEPPHG